MYQVGDLVYFDSFSGLIPCKVLDIGHDSYGNTVSTTLKVTARKPRNGYKAREVFSQSSSTWIIERHRVYVRCGQYHIRPRVGCSTSTYSPNGGAIHD